MITAVLVYDSMDINKKQGMMRIGMTLLSIAFGSFCFFSFSPLFLRTGSDELDLIF